jgi:hypothetical protein
MTFRILTSSQQFSKMQNVLMISESKIFICDWQVISILYRKTVFRTQCQEDVCRTAGKGKGKFYTRTGHEDPEGRRDSCTLSLTSALDGLGGEHHAPAALSRERDTISIVQEAGWAPGPMWMGEENLALDSRTVQPVASRFTD